jgi:hypothetical protein
VIWLWVVVAVVVLAAATLGPVLAGRFRRADGGGAAIAARERGELLGHHVTDLPVTDDAQAAAELRAARERWESAGSVLATARTDDDYALAQRTAVEGLDHLRAAHARLGLPAPEH